MLKQPTIKIVICILISLPPYSFVFISSADFCQVELIWYQFVRRPVASGIRRRTSTFSNRYFSYIFQWILLKLGTLISWVSPQILFFSESWNLDFLIFLWIFIKFSLKSLLLLQFPMDSRETIYTYYLGQSSHLLFSFFKFAFFLICYEFSLKSLLLLQFPMDSFATSYTYSLGQSSHLLFRFLKFVFFYFLAEFSSKFHSNRYCSYNI